MSVHCFWLLQGRRSHVRPPLHFKQFQFTAPPTYQFWNYFLTFSQCGQWPRRRVYLKELFCFSATREVKLTSPGQYCTLEDLCWCISACMGHSLVSYIEWNRLLHATPVSCASTYPCRAKIQSEIPHRALSSCLHPFWQNLHFSLAICSLCYMSPFQASLP